MAYTFYFPVQRCRERLKESRGKFLERYRAISSESTSPTPSSSSVNVEQSHTPVTEVGGATAAIGGASSSPVFPPNSAQTISNDAIRSSIQEVMRKEWESMREENSGLPQLPGDTPCGKKGRGEWFDDDDSMEEVSYISWDFNFLFVLSLLSLDYHTIFMCTFSHVIYTLSREVSKNGRVVQHRFYNANFCLMWF